MGDASIYDDAGSATAFPFSRRVSADVGPKKGQEKAGVNPGGGPRVINLNFNRPSAARIVAIFIGALLIVLLIAVLLTSYYTVGAESEGVVLRFGKFLRTVEPELHFKLPFGIDGGDRATDSAAVETGVRFLHGGLHESDADRPGSEGGKIHGHR